MSDEVEDGIDEEIMNKISFAKSEILDLIGQIAKLRVLLIEIPEDCIGPVLDRYAMLLESVDALPIKFQLVGDA